ncbi:hypothetical protein ABH922_005689 [Rhodococcus sp. 27YEA15]
MDYYERPDLETFTATAKQRNLGKQAGFYVDWDGESITSPLSTTADDIADIIPRAAQVVQIHLIEDHTRQQDAADHSLINSAEDLHWAVMPYSDPELFADFAARHSADGDEYGRGGTSRGALSGTRSLRLSGAVVLTLTLIGRRSRGQGLRV